MGAGVRTPVRPPGRPDSGGGPDGRPARFGGWSGPIFGVAGHRAGHAGRTAVHGCQGHLVRPARAKSATPEDPHARKPVAAMSKMPASLASVAGAFQSWVCKVSDDADSKEGVLLADAQAPWPHHDPPCRAHPCIPRLPVSQFAFVGFCRARGLTPSKLQVEQAFKKWATESGHTLSTSQDVDGAKVWKSRKGSKLTCAAAPPCTCPPPRCAVPTTPPAAGDRNLSFEPAPSSLPADLGTYREGLERLGVVLPTTVAGAEWKGAFTPVQWAALLAQGKARLASCPGTPAASQPRSTSPSTSTSHLSPPPPVCPRNLIILCMCTSWDMSKKTRAEKT